MIRRLVQKQKRKFGNKKLRRNFYLLAGNEFFAELRLFYPVAVLAFEAVTGSFALAMSVFAVMGMAQALSEIPTGMLADKIGRRKVLILGSAAEFLGVLCYFLSFSSAHGLALLYAGGVAFGFANAMFSGNNDAMLYETLSFYKRPHEISRLIGRVSSMGQMALALSGILATFCLWLGFSYRDLMMFSLVSVGIGVVLSLFTIEPPQHVTEDSHVGLHMLQSLRLILKHPRLRWLAFASAIRTGLNQTANSFVPSFVETVWPRWLTPLYRTAQNGIGSLGFWFSGYITKRLGAPKALFSGTVFSTIVSLLAYTIASIMSPFLLIITQLSYAVTRTADSALQQENFSNAQRATMGSLISFASAIVGGISSLLVGFLADSMGAASSLTTLLLCSVPVSLIYFVLYQKDISSTRKTHEKLTNVTDG